MRLRDLSCGAALAMVLAFAAPVGSAQAQAAAACEENQFSAKAGAVYLDAENAYISEDAGSLEKARELIAKLKTMELNCYEAGIAVRLSAAINVKAGDYGAAVKDLETALPGLPEADKLNTYYQIAQLYLQLDNFEKAVGYLEKWIAAGAKPDKNQNMQLATMYQKLGNNDKAIYFLENMLKQEPNPDKTVIDFAVYLYNETGQKAKLADFLMNKVIPRFAGEKKYYEVMSALYYEDNNDRKAFEVVKAMYLAGFLKTESEVMRVVNFYNAFNAPFEAAKLMEKEMNAGRIEQTPEKLDTLANLYQVAREYDRAIPVIQKLADTTGSGKAYERLGRSYFEMGKYAEAEKALRTALQKGGMKEPGFAWVLIGQMKHREEKRSEAREAFQKAANMGDRGGTGWLSFMNSEDETREALRTFDIRVKFDELRNIKKQCEQIRVLGGEPPANCKTVDADLAGVGEQLGLNPDGSPMEKKAESTDEAKADDGKDDA